MSDEDVERVAAAIWSQHTGQSEFAVDTYDHGEFEREWWRMIARVAIAAMNKPPINEPVRPAPQFVHPAFPYENPRTPAETEAMLNHMADVHLTPTEEKLK